MWILEFVMFYKNENGKQRNRNIFRAGFIACILKFIIILVQYPKVFNATTRIELSYIGSL